MTSGQVCTLVLLSATCFGLIIALATRDHLEYGWTQLFLECVAGLVLSIVVVIRTVLDRHSRERRARGHRHAFWGLVPLPPRPTPAERTQANSLPLHREQSELSVVSALCALPETPFVSDEDAECALCMDTLSRGEMIRVLPRCGHQYHTKCIDRWLLEGQAHQRRRCPLCNAEPIETPYGITAIFEDPFGNLWDVVQRADS